MKIERGTRLGPYEMVAPIGAGGMGEVWRARDTRLDRSVAVKILAEFAHNAQLKLRFEREAKTVSQLNHPNICTLYDVGDDYLVMELLDGESLADRIARGPLPLADVLKYGAQIAEALDRAHRAGVVHRDLKPGNIMITKSGAKLLDFGLAKMSVVNVGPEGDTVQKPLTQEGTILGTFQYMAPEQLEGSEADARTDIFALGALLYEMATGRRAFQGKTKTSLIAAIVKEQPARVSEIQPLTPPALEHVIAKCLEKDPGDRWQSAHDVAEQLRWTSEAGSQAGVAAPLLSRRKTRERVAWGVAVVTLVALGASAPLILRATRAPAMYSLTVPRTDAGYILAGAADVSPDGSMLAFSAAESYEASRQLYVREMRSFELRALPGTEGVGRFAWSSDNRSIVFTADAKVKIVDVDGGNARVLTEGSGVFGLAMNGEGDVLVGGGNQGLKRISSRGGAARTITTPPRGGDDLHTFPRFLPDGRRFLFLSSGRDPATRAWRHTLAAGSLDSPEVKVVGEVPSAVAYSPTGHLLMVRDGTLSAIRFDARKLQMTGEPESIADGVHFFKPMGQAEFSVSRNGVLTYRGPFGGESLAWVDRTGRRMGRVGPTGNLGRFRITPDGRSVAAVVVDDRIGTGDLWMFGTRRETGTRVTFDADYEDRPVLTPDGKRLIYGSDRLGVPDIFIRELGSAGDPKPLVVAPGEQYPGDVSPDGKWLVFDSNEYTASRFDIKIVPLDGSGPPVPFVATPFSETEPRFSPDGRWVAYQSSESGKSQVYLKPFPGPGEARQVSIAGGTQARWASDGKRVYFRSRSGIYVADVASPDAEPQLLFEPGERYQSFEVAPDEQRFLLSAWDDVAAQTPTRVVVNWPELLRAKTAKRK